MASVEYGIIRRRRSLDRSPQQTSDAASNDIDRLRPRCRRHLGFNIVAFLTQGIDIGSNQVYEVEIL